eukprot:1161921-Pelagomonas_calceolata.AAC.3
MEVRVHSRVCATRGRLPACEQGLCVQRTQRGQVHIRDVVPCTARYQRQLLKQVAVHLHQHHPLLLLFGPRLAPLLSPAPPVRHPRQVPLPVPTHLSLTASAAAAPITVITAPAAVLAAPKVPDRAFYARAHTLQALVKARRQGAATTPANATPAAPLLTAAPARIITHHQPIQTHSLCTNPIPTPTPTIDTACNCTPALRPRTQGATDTPGALSWLQRACPIR